MNQFITNLKAVSKNPNIILGDKQSKTVDGRKQQRSSFESLADIHVQFLRDFLCKNIKQVKSKDGDILHVATADLNEFARLLMLAKLPEPLHILHLIHNAPSKETRRMRVEMNSLSFDAMWSDLANDFMNNSAWTPSNDWYQNDERIKNIHPNVAPLVPWSGEKLRETLRLFRTNFTIVKDVFRKSGSLEAGHELDEADRFWGHVQRLLVNVSEDVRLIILFSFWVFDGSWPTFLSSLQPESHQFDIGVKRSLPIDLTDTGSTQDARSGKRTPTNGGFEILAQAMKSTAQEDEFTKHMIEGAKDQHKISCICYEACKLRGRPNHDESS